MRWQDVFIITTYSQSWQGSTFHSKVVTKMQLSAIYSLRKESLIAETRTQTVHDVIN